MAFEGELEHNLLKLCADINGNSYTPDPYNHRIVNQKKRRDIAVASVRDRVVHRLLYDYLVPLVDNRLDYDVWSCRSGKGLHAGLLRVKGLMDKYSSCYVWRGDIAKFFDNVDHRKLKECLSRFVSDEKAKELLDRVIDSYSHNDIVSQSVSQSRQRYTYW